MLISKLIQALRHCCDPTATRYAMNYILVRRRNTERKTEAIASDGHMLAVLERDDDYLPYTIDEHPSMSSVDPTNEAPIIDVLVNPDDIAELAAKTKNSRKPVLRDNLVLNWPNWEEPLSAKDLEKARKDPNWTAHNNGPITLKVHDGEKQRSLEVLEIEGRFPNIHDILLKTNERPYLEVAFSIELLESLLKTAKEVHKEAGNQDDEDTPRIVFEIPDDNSSTFFRVPLRHGNGYKFHGVLMPCKVGD